MTPEETILICAVRYALGRMSYIVHDVCQYVAFTRKKLSQNCINIIIRDIDEELERYHNAGQFLGMECDERQWIKLRDLLKEEIKDEELADWLTTITTDAQRTIVQTECFVDYQWEEWLQSEVD